MTEKIPKEVEKKFGKVIPIEKVREIKEAEKRDKKIEEEVIKAFEQVRDAIKRRPEQIDRIKKLYKRALVMWKLNFNKVDKDIINAMRQEIKKLFKEAKKRETSGFFVSS